MHAEARGVWPTVLVHVHTPWTRVQCLCRHNALLYCVACLSHYLCGLSVISCLLRVWSVCLFCGRGLSGDLIPYTMCMCVCVCMCVFVCVCVCVRARARGAVAGGEVFVD